MCCGLEQKSIGSPLQVVCSGEIWDSNEIHDGGDDRFVIEVIDKLCGFLDI